VIFLCMAGGPSGSATDNLPGFIVLTSAGRHGQQSISARQWSSGVLPSRFQGLDVRLTGIAGNVVTGLIA
jgi:hypothetical protein